MSMLPESNQISRSSSHFLSKIGTALTDIETNIFKDLTTQDDDEVMVSRRKAKELGKAAWRIEAACDAQIVTRAQAKKPLGGSRTKSGVVMAAVRKRAKEIQCTPRYIFRNAAIFNLIREVESIPENTTNVSVLDERGFYNTALMAADPKAAVLLFARKKLSTKRFRVTDALRLLEREGLTKKAAVKNAINLARQTGEVLAERQTEIDHINSVINYVRENVFCDCPSDEISRIHLAYIEELQEYIQEFLFDEDAGKALELAWLSGKQDEVGLSKATGFPLDTVSHEMKMLYGLGKFIPIPNTSPQRWHKVGHNLPPELRRRKD